MLLVGGIFLDLLFYLKKESIPRFTFSADCGVLKYPHHIGVEWSDLYCVEGGGNVVCSFGVSWVNI